MMTSEEYMNALNIEAGKAMGWHQRPQKGGNYMLWADAKDAARCACRFWDPTHKDHQLIVLLAKVLDSGKAYSLCLENHHSLADPAWLATICGKGNRVAREPGDNSWRVALVKACVVICGGELPEDVMAA